MTFIAGMMIVGFISYIAWVMGRMHQAEAEYREEQLDQEAYLWALKHDRFPTITRIVDLETGEVVDEKIR